MNGAVNDTDISTPTPPPSLNGININGNGTSNDVGPSGTLKFSTGLILPSPDVKSTIDRTIVHMNRSSDPLQFEVKLRESRRTDPAFSFLNPADPYHAYYRDSAVDLYVLPRFYVYSSWPLIPGELSVKEGRNYQFDFLKPTHSLFGYFNRLIEQYTKVLMPTQETLNKLKERTEDGAKWKMLAEARAHATWERTRREQEKKREDDREAERIAFAEIDWHDYAIVQTIEFTAADAAAELPPPMSVQEVENMTLAQKRMAAMVMETTVEDVEAHRARQAAAEAEAAAAVSSAGGAAGIEEVDDDVMMEEKERQKELERAKAIQATSLEAGATMKIRTDYVPKLGARNKVALATCSICGQQIPVNELQEHMRIELLDPRWNPEGAGLGLQRGANVVSSLKNLARTRVDIFGTETDEERRKREEEEERERRKEREKVVWDGHTATKAGTLDKYSTNVNFDEQIAAIHRAKGLGPQEANAIGPGIGPAAAPPPLAAAAPPALPIPAKPVDVVTKDPSYTAATISSGPQPPSMYPTPAPPVMLPPLHYQGLDSVQPFGYQPPPPGRVPPFTATAAPAPTPAPAPAPSPSAAGTVRPADQMEGDGDDTPPSKRQRVAKLPGGQYYPEQDWINMHPHPISLQVQLPLDTSKPEWKLDGTIVTIADLSLNLLVSTLRDRIITVTGSALSAGRLILSYNGKMLTNRNTIASYNLEDEDLLVLSVRDPKKK
ncbi:Pre-mRNA splicing factor PRP21 like protein-domain-containing protein [Multifurca ochricompacta]|uniref:Pre-mRNA splicing factor PRP21 like protein-domain-containing protein n=1 Tax=Multifurca ochricompacta TaxID=376703 RepID=A0AAD4M5S1_9AGAM|nr:Pre-mRNA splicing factor PRP21 like protein-domain-containing protein [Multifurca ochricompacta]